MLNHNLHSLGPDVYIFQVELFFGISMFVTLLEAISSLGCRRNSSSGSMLMRQLTEAQLLTSFKTTLGVFSVHAVEIT